MNPTWRILWATPELWWALQHLNAALQPALNNQPHRGPLLSWVSLCAKSVALSLPLFQLAADYRAIFHHNSNNEWGLRGQCIFVSLSFICVRWITDYYCHWQRVSSPFICYGIVGVVVVCAAYTALSIGYPKTLSGLQFSHNCRSLIRHMLRTW